MPGKKFTASRLDRAIGYLSPRALVYRLQDRAAAQAMQALTGGYDSARRNRLNQNWIPTLGSADTDILPDLTELRAKSRSLLRNDGYAQVVASIVDHVVGTGLTPHSSVNTTALGITEEEAEAFEDQAEDLFELWCPHADARGILDFDAVQRLGYRAVLEDGEFFARRVRRTEIAMRERGTPYSPMYEMIDPDRVVSPDRSIIRMLPNNRMMKHGIECNAFGSPKAYWVLKKHPAEGRVTRGRSAFVRVPASEILHVFRPLRVGQTRGVPHLSPDLETFHQLGELFKYELVTAQVGACYSMFLEQADPNLAAAAVPGETDIDGNKEQYLEPGLITRLRKGEKPHSFNPNRPGDAFPPFVEILLRKMSAGANVTYEHLARDFSKTNFSSGRQAQQLTQKFYRSEREMTACRFAQPVWREVMEEAYLAGDLEPPRGSIRDPRRKAFYYNAVWSGPGSGYVDPVKEVAASKAAVDMGISSLSIEAAGQGRNWKAIIDQRSREQRYAERKGVVLDGPSPVHQTLDAVRERENEEEKAA